MAGASKKYRINFSNRLIDLSLRESIVRDMTRTDPIYHPDSHWIKAEEQLLEYIRTSNDFFANYQFEDRYRLGQNHRSMEYIDPLGIHKEYENYDFLPFTRSIDHMNKILALHSLLQKLNQVKGNKKLFVLEVGGGYGRTALFFLNYFGPQICYVNVDAVPSAVLISQQFLCYNCRSDIRIGGYRDVRKTKVAGKPLKLERFNYLSLPAWEIDRLPSHLFDIVINIWSMQEMSRHHEKLYYEFWERVGKQNALLFFLNRNKLNFIEGYHFPKKWIFLYKGKEATFGNPERFFIINPSRELSNKLIYNDFFTKIKYKFMKGTPIISSEFELLIKFLTSKL